MGHLGANLVPGCQPDRCADCHNRNNGSYNNSSCLDRDMTSGDDIADVTPQEMRSLVCAQCHVEYYFKGDGEYLTFPWDGGFTMEDMEAYLTMQSMQTDSQCEQGSDAESSAPRLRVVHTWSSC